MVMRFSVELKPRPYVSQLEDAIETFHKNVGGTVTQFPKMPSRWRVNITANLRMLAKRGRSVLVASSRPSGTRRVIYGGRFEVQRSDRFLAGLGASYAP